MNTQGTKPDSDQKWSVNSLAPEKNCHTQWNWDRKRLGAALWSSRIQTNVTFGYLVLDALSIFGVFSWSIGVLRSVIFICWICHMYSGFTVVTIVSEYRRYGFLKKNASIVYGTAPASILAFIAFFGGTQNPTGVVLPICLGLMMISNWGAASVARAMLKQNTAEPTRPI